MATVSSLLKMNGCVRLPHLAALDVKGADAEKFLQGQTSAQVSLANGFFAPLTCFCTPKGRMLANAQLLKISNDHYRLLLSTSLIDMLASHLAKFAAFLSRRIAGSVIDAYRRRQRKCQRGCSSVWFSAS